MSVYMYDQKDTEASTKSEKMTENFEEKGVLK